MFKIKIINNVNYAGCRKTKQDVLKIYWQVTQQLLLLFPQENNVYFLVIASYVEGAVSYCNTVENNLPISKSKPFVDFSKDH